VIRLLGADEARGLSTDEARRRLVCYGPNQLPETGPAGPWLTLLKQFTSTVVVILIIGAAVSLALGDMADAAAIGAILVLNALLGFSQEYRADKAMAALRRIVVPTVRVRRDGVVSQLLAREVTPGDIILLEAGFAVAADCRVLESVNLRTQEATLTGESAPVGKDWRPLADPDPPLAERTNMAFMGTSVIAGRGLAVVTATGLNTELGHVASLVQATVREPTPLERRLNQLGRWLVLAALAVVTLIFTLGLMRGQPFALMLITAVSIAVAAVPEGLPAVVTIALALGAQQMFKRRALIRKLPAVETLGSVTAICSDKTGTLTENQMTVVELRVPGAEMTIPRELMNGPMNGATGLAAERFSESGPLRLLVAAAALCNDAQLDSSGEYINVTGDPTEAALVLAAARLGLKKNVIENELPRVAEVPFESERKMMTTIHRSVVPGHPSV
jgi:Ca2+-transporting ATPase